MASLPPVTMTVKADTTEFLKSVEEAKKAVAGIKPSDYQIRLDALKLTIQMDANQTLTPSMFAEWQEFFERSLRDALDH